MSEYRYRLGLINATAPVGTMESIEIGNSVPRWSEADELNLAIRARRLGAVPVPPRTIDMRDRSWLAAPGFRVHAYRRAACPWQDHRWVRLVVGGEGDIIAEGMVIAVLCETCGRWPLEALVETVTAAALDPDPSADIGS